MRDMLLILYKNIAFTNINHSVIFGNKNNLFSIQKHV